MDQIIVDDEQKFEMGVTLINDPLDSSDHSKYILGPKGLWGPQDSVKMRFFIFQV